MRTFDAVWHWDGITFTDVSTAAASRGLNLAVQGGHKLYMMHEDWISGALFLITSGASDLSYVAERWDGERWGRLNQQEGYEQLNSGFDVLEQASAFVGNTLIDWGRAPGRWGLKVPTNTFPESVAPPDTEGRYWVRIRFTSGGPATLDRILPVLYNTYTNYSELASFMEIPEFDEVNTPTASEARKRIRRAEDWLDQYTRRSWRPRYVKNETHDFNPYGMGLNRKPVLFATELGLWNGTSFEDWVIGRGEDSFIDPGTGMLYPNTPSFRLRYYSFLLSRHIRAPKAFRISYVYGADVDIDETGGTATDIVLRRAAADMVLNADWTTYLTSGLDVVPKPSKVQIWQQQAQEAADNLRWTRMV